MWIESVLFLVAVYFIWQNVKKPSNYPPGKWGYPLVGHIPFGMKSMAQKLKEMQQEYGDVVSWRLGTRHLVFLFDFQLAKEAFHGTNFVDRPDLKFFSLVTGETNLGVIATNGIHWQNIRRFSMRHLRDLGMGKSKFVTAVQFEATELVNQMKKLAGNPAPIPDILMTAVLNVVWQLIANKRYDLYDKKIADFHHLITEIQDNFTLVALSDFIPWVKRIFPEFILNRITKKYKYVELSNDMRTYFQGFIDENKSTLDTSNPRDFIDAYLIELEKQNSDFNSTMSNEDLIYCIADLFGAGSETTTYTLKWAILYLASFPEVQKKLQKEIDEVLPKGISATLEDRARLPYTEAFIHEVLRYSSLAIFGGIHEASIETKLGGYTIPKGAFVMSANNFVHRNPKHFSSPDEFKPERFMDSEGKLAVPREGFIPFGTGRRQCMGESLARMELLIFVTTMVQNLNFDTPPGGTIDIVPDEKNVFFHMPTKQDVLTTIRA